MKIYRNATRNFFIGGSGDNLGDLNPTYLELHEITKKVRRRYLEKDLKKY